MFDVCVVGSSNLDLVVTADRHPRPGETVLGRGYDEYPGGKGLNQAVAARRAGAATAFASALGDDAAAVSLAAVLAAEQIDTGAIQHCDGIPSGRALITVASGGENSIVVVAGANGAIRPAPLPPARVVLVQLEVPVDVVADALRQAVAMGAVTVLNPAPATTVADEVLADCRIVIPNEHERDLMGGTQRLLDLGVEAVITTLGGEGADVASADGVVRVAPFAVDPVDTTGAGDAFCGALAAAVSRDATLLDAVRFGAAAGALATTRAGAVPSLPHRADIEALING